MITRVATAALAVALGAAGCAQPVEAPHPAHRERPGLTATAATMAAPLADRLDGAVERVMAEAGIPGAIIGIWTPDGDYVRAFGVADKKTRAPMKTDLYSRIGSLTRTFTVTAVLLLADQRKLGLDDPIAEHLDGIPGGEAVTLRQLARMRSGLPDYTTNPEFVSAAFADPARAFTPAQLLELAFFPPTVFATGAGYHHSNTDTVLLGLVVEKVSGQSLADYIREHISAPLGMEATSFPTDASFPRPHAAGYTVQTPDDGETTATDWNPSRSWAAGNMVSTLHDMRIWAPALANGTLLSPAMQRQRLVDGSGGPAPEGYGLGVSNFAGWVGYAGSVPGYQCVSVHLPGRQTTLVIMTNTDIAFRGAQPSALLATAVTAELTPDHVYRTD
ncbi:serine hydrolase domain-containing protein [Mycobacterium sp. ZZG]